MNNNLVDNNQDIVFYKDENGNFNIEDLIKNEDVWLNVNSIAKLFNVDRTGIIRHIANIYRDEELEESSTCAKIAQVQNEGNRKVTRVKEYYNLDMIISIGFLVRQRLS